MRKNWRFIAIILGVTLALAGCGDSATGDGTTGTGLFAGTTSSEQSESLVGTTSALGTYMGTIEAYQSTFDTLFDADGYRVVAVGSNGDAGIEDGKYGVIDTEGNFVVEPIYDEIVWEFYTEAGNAGEDVLPSVFYNGYLQVVKDGKMGLVDETGTEVIPCEYTTVCMPSEGICTLYNRIDGMYAYESYCSYVGYWSLEKGCEILSPDTYYCMVENFPIDNNEDGTGYTYKPEGDAYCVGDFIGGYAMVITDPTYVMDANTTLSSTTLTMDYVNLIDTEGNFLYGQSYLTIWFKDSGFTAYPQHSDYLAIYQLLDYSGQSVVTEYGATVSLSKSKVYGAGVICASGTVLAAEYTAGAHTDGASFYINTVYPTIDLENNCISIGYSIAPGTICETGMAYFTLSGQATTAPAEEATAEYTIVIQDGLNGIQSADGTMTVPYKYTYIKQGVNGSTWYVCRDESGMYGMVDITTGEEILPCMYDRVGFSITDGQENINNFELGVCYVSLGDNEYLVNANNEIVVDITGLNVSEAYNGLYPCSSLEGYMDNQGRIVLPSYTATRGLDDPYSSYTLYEKDGIVYQISANYLVDSSKVYGETTAVYIPDVSTAYCEIETQSAKTTYVVGDAFSIDGLSVVYGLLHSGGYADVAATASYAIGEEPLAVGDVFDTAGEYTVTISVGDEDAKTTLGSFGITVLAQADYLLDGDYYIATGDYYIAEFLYADTKHYFMLVEASERSVFTLTWKGGDLYVIQSADSGTYLGYAFMGELEGVDDTQLQWVLSEQSSGYTMSPSTVDGMLVAPNWDEGLGAWVYLDWEENTSADCTILQFIPVG